MQVVSCYKNAGDVLLLMRYIHIVVVCTNLSGREPDINVGVGRMMISGGLGGIVVSTLAQNASDVGSIPALGEIFLIFITSMTLVAVAMILYILNALWLLNLS